MKAAFIIYHDILETRLTPLLNSLSIDYYTKWEDVKGKGHKTDAHLGTRTFPGFNQVLFIVFDTEEVLDQLISGITVINQEAQRDDDKVRLFQIPVERII